MARRRSQIAKRFSTMKGISGSEKSMLLRIGEVVDGAINNRTPANPFEKNSRTKTDPRLPPPGTITVKDGVRSVNLSWAAVNSSILMYYRVQIISLENDTVELDKITSTPNFIFKAGAGKYRALVNSVGRNGTASRAVGVEFFIPSTVMLLEGTKNGVQTISNIVSETILTPKDYKVFVWGAFTLDNFANPSSNSLATAELLMGEDIGTAVTLQSLSMFGESETFTNMDDNAGFGISRPVVALRQLGDLFETSQSLRFAVEDVTDAMAGKLITFWVRIINRETSDTTNENDVASLSIVVWVTSTGREVILPEAPAIIESINMGNTTKSGDPNAGNAFQAIVPAGNVVLGNVWTSNTWVKIPNLALEGIPNIGAPIYGMEAIAATTSASSHDFFGDGLNAGHNSRLVWFERTDGNDFTNGNIASGGGHELEPGFAAIRIGAAAFRSRSSLAKSFPHPTWNRTFYDLDPAFPSGPHTVPARTYLATDPSSLFFLGVDQWHMVTAVWDGTISFGSQRIFIYVNGLPLNESFVELTRDETVSCTQAGPDTQIGTSTPVQDYILTNYTGYLRSASPDTLISMGVPVGGDGVSKSMRYSSTGWWNVALSAAEIASLYNEGVDFNWKENSDSYTSAGNLQHYWQMQDYDETLQTIIDSGLNSVGTSTMARITPGTPPETQSPNPTLVEDVPGDDDN